MEHDTTTAAPQIALRPLEGLEPYARNARTHSPEQISQIKASLLEFGWTNAVLADDAGIVAGHGRTLAAGELYREGQQIRFPNGAPIPIGMVPVIDCTGWTAQQRKAYILADNQLALNAGWDEALLASELAELSDAGFDAALTGFGDAELARLMGDMEPPARDADPDAAPPAPEEPISRPGDLWLCGEHRVLCGSATVAGDWARLMDGELADVCWTDPPYNVDVGGKNDMIDKQRGTRTSRPNGLMNDKMAGKAFRELLDGMYREVYGVMRPGAPIYVAHSDSEGVNFRSAMIEAGFKLSSCVIWNKNHFVLGRMDYQAKHEPILYGWKPGATHSWYGGRKNASVLDLASAMPVAEMEDGRYQLTVGDQVFVLPADCELERHEPSVLFAPKPMRSDLHPTQKPVPLIERMLRNSAKRGDVVIDAFGGSGSTLIAAESMGMRARLVELDPKFVDVICQRYMHYTGHAPVNASTGKKFPSYTPSPDT